MITRRFRVGMRLMLPSGNILFLVRREEGAWIGQYTELSKLRGEVSLCPAWLRAHCFEV
jgi:hypothetical protein